jgi:hypothetical protein
MILETCKTIALKNNEGGYDIKNISVFEANDFNVFFSLTHSRNNNSKNIIIRVRCPLCGSYHTYNYKTTDFIKRELIVGGCELIGMPLFYIGNKLKVEQRVNKYNKIEKKICAYI